MKRLLAALTAALVALAVATLPSPAGAQTEEAGLTIREVDTTNFPEVRISALSNGPPPTPEQFTLRENGRLVPNVEVVPLAETGTTVGIVLVIDISESMRTNNALEQAKAAAKRFVDGVRPGDQLALVSFGSTATVQVGFTPNRDRVKQAIDGLSVVGQTALWDGVRTAVDLFENRPDLQANVVLLSDGTDTSSSTSEGEAVSSAQSAAATVFSIGLEGDKFDPAAVRNLAVATGGFYSGANDPGALDQVYQGVQSVLQNQYELRYVSASEEASLDLVLAARGASATASVNTGTVASGAKAAPDIIKPKTGILTNGIVFWLGLLAVFGAVALAAYGIVLLLSREQTSLRSVLRPYAALRGEGSTSTIAYDDDDEEGGGFADSRFVQRAVSMTEGIARRRGLLTRVEGALERADLPLRAAEAILIYVTAAVVISILGFVLTRNVLGGFLVMLFAVLVPPAVVNLMGGLRRRKFVSQLPDTLQLLSGSLRAGYSLMQGVDAVSQEVDEPMGKELRRITAETRLGRPLEEALDDCAERMASADFTWAVMAIKIQREVGGNLAELLMTVSDTMIARERLRREIRALTAEGRISAILLGFLPIGIGLAVWSLNREYMEVLFDETVGQFMLGGSIVLALIGFYWMKKVIEIEI